ncbi:MAG: phosphatidylglycerol lysyltransferase [Spirochaetaceae bacterium]|jgi:phosphoglucomutase|nr:phosphatidylglycerol lysyltransferase [Spirochaetaceae bacterium]
MILSASGWRDVFAADGDAESARRDISDFHAFAAATAAAVFADFLRAKTQANAPRSSIIVGIDTRPTGGAVAAEVLNALAAKGCRVLFCGVAAAPEIMAYARSCGEDGGADAFIYISASHNPIGYNGIKFGLTDGGVLGGADMARLEEEFQARTSAWDGAFPASGKAGIAVTEALNKAPLYKSAALASYRDFSLETATGGQDAILSELKSAISAAPLGIAADFNGSARAASIDKAFFEGLGLKFASINDRPGEISHRIVPEGEALRPACDFLSEKRRTDGDFVLAYTPDCDGDRGNIVFFDENAGHVRQAEAQEVFALACLAGLCQLAWTGDTGAGTGAGAGTEKIAVAVNDATSMRIDAIARAFGAKVFRAETGEANVVGLGRRLRTEGWTVPITGEGAAGGSIVHPSSVRDPIQTVVALLKLLRIRSRAVKKGFFELWCERNGKPCADDFTLSGITGSLPAFTTTSAYSEEARLEVQSRDHAALKARYQYLFAAEWERRKSRLRSEWGISGWTASVYKGSEERRGVENFGEAGRGGLRIVFHDESGADRASLWMRGSGTEPVFRVMADVEGLAPALHDELLAWHRGMVLEADRGQNSAFS